jgi:hypothetical protein
MSNHCNQILKKIATPFLNLAPKGKSREAFHLYGGQEFEHHNVYFKGDAETPMLAMEEGARIVQIKGLKLKAFWKIVSSLRFILKLDKTRMIWVWHPCI